MADSTVTFRKMTVSYREQFNKVFAQLRNKGLLLVSDSDFPNVANIITGERIRGSWWRNDFAHDIFVTSEELEDHPDVMIVKLLSGKVTFVHRELWNRIYSIGIAREEWQLQNLSSNASALLKMLDEVGSIQTNKLGKKFGPKPGETARELELRLLLYTQQIHTESGAHAKVLETWDVWAKRVGFKARSKSAPTAKRFLEKHVAEINNKHGATVSLPWCTHTRKR